MTVELNRIGWRFWLQWVLASSVGMFVGFAMAFPISLLISDVLGQPLLALLQAGIVTGIGVGVLQWLVLRRRVTGAGWWVLTSAAGCFAILLAGAAGYPESLRDFGSHLSWTDVVVVAALGGAVTGTLQWLVLRGQVSRTGWWVLASTVGWGLGMTAARAYSGVVGEPDSGGLFVAGAVLGAVTGGPLGWLLRQPVPEA